MDTTESKTSPQSPLSVDVEPKEFDWHVANALKAAVVARRLRFENMLRHRKQRIIDAWDNQMRPLQLPRSYWHMLDREQTEKFKRGDWVHTQYKSHRDFLEHAECCITYFPYEEEEDAAPAYEPQDMVHHVVATSRKTVKTRSVIPETSEMWDGSLPFITYCCKRRCHPIQPWYKQGDISKLKCRTEGRKALEEKLQQKRVAKKEGARKQQFVAKQRTLDRTLCRDAKYASQGIGDIFRIPTSMRECLDATTGAIGTASTGIESISEAVTNLINSFASFMNPCMIDLLLWISNIAETGFSYSNVIGIAYQIAKAHKITYNVVIESLNLIKGFIFYQSQDFSSAIVPFLTQFACVVDMIFCGKVLTADKIKEHFALIGRAAQGVKATYGALTVLVEYLKDLYYMNLYGKTKAEIQLLKTYPRLSQLRAAVELLKESNVSDIVKQKKLCEQIIRIERELMEYKMKAIKLNDNTTKQILDVVISSAKEIFRLAHSSPALHVRSRVCPSTLYVFGESGTGKTLFVEYLQNELVNVYRESDPNITLDSISFTRRVRNEFWDGYAHQPVVIYDDFMQAIDAVNNPNDEVAELIDVVNDAPLHLHMSDIIDKKCVYFSSDIVILSSNTRVPLPKSITNPDAIQRRCHMCIDVKVRKECGNLVTNEKGVKYYQMDEDKTAQYMQQNNLGSFDAFSTCQYLVDVYKMKPKGQSEIVRANVEFDTILQEILDHFKTKKDKNKRIKDAMRKRAGITEVAEKSATVEEIEDLLKPIDIDKFIKDLENSESNVSIVRSKVEDAFEDAKEKLLFPGIELVKTTALSLRDKFNELVTRCQDELRGILSYLVIKTLDFADSFFGFIVGFFGQTKDCIVNMLASNVVKDMSEILLNVSFSILASIILAKISDLIFSRFRKDEVDVVCPFVLYGGDNSVPCMSCSKCKYYQLTKDIDYEVHLRLLGITGKLKETPENITRYFSQSKELQTRHSKPRPTMRKQSCDFVLFGGSSSIPCKKCEPCIRNSLDLDIEILPHILTRFINYKLTKVEEDNIDRFFDAFPFPEYAGQSSQSEIRKTRHRKIKSKPGCDFVLYGGSSMDPCRQCPSCVSHGLDTDIDIPIHLATRYVNGKLDEVECSNFDTYIRTYSQQSKEVSTRNQRKSAFRAQDGTRYIPQHEVYKCRDLVSYEQSTSTLRQNGCVLVFSKPEKDFVTVANINCIFVAGRIGLTTFHSFTKGYTNLVMRCPNDNFQTMEIPLSELKIHQLIDATNNPVDLCFVEFPNCIPSRKNIVNKFLKASSFALVDTEATAITRSGFSKSPSKNQDARSSSFHIAETTTSEFEIGVNTIPIVYDDIICNSWIEYSAFNSNGMCGSLLSLSGSCFNEKLIGMHIAGDPKQSASLAYPLSQEFINANLERCNIGDRKLIDGRAPYSKQELSGDFIPLGKLSQVPSCPTVTNLNPSLIHNEYFETLTKPAYLTPQRRGGILIDPKEKGLAKVTKGQVYVPERDFKIVAADVENLFRKEREPYILTMEQAVTGLEDRPYVAPLNRTSSPGFPFNLCNPGKGKRHWTGEDEYCITDELREEVETLLENCRNNRRGDVIFVATLKDERRPIAKVEEIKTRVFEAAPQHFVIAFRMYFMAFAEMIMENKISNEIAVGTNVYSIDWHRIGTALSTKGDKVIAGDFSNFDGSISNQILNVILDMINKWYDGTAEETLIRTVLWEEICSTNVLCGKDLIRQTHSQPSGNPFTVIINSLVNSLVMRLCYLYLKRDQSIDGKFDFRKNVSLISYGDDNVLNISDAVIDWFNQVSISEAAIKCGYTYTDEGKTGKVVPYRHLSDIGFLKRGFVKSITGFYRAPLDINVVKDMSNWVRGKAVVASTKENVETSLRELALHGEDVYDEASTALRKACSRKGVKIDVPSYAEWEDIFGFDFFGQ